MSVIVKWKVILDRTASERNFAICLIEIRGTVLEMKLGTNVASPPSDQF
jgi:hypothetical protein